MEPKRKDSSNPEEAFRAVCRDVLAPLVEADGGVLHWVEWSASEVHLHLTGACAGCPGAELTKRTIFEPVLSKIAPKVQLKLTTGWLTPPGAQRVSASAT